MATTKVTFTLDPATIQRLQEAAERLAVPKSEIVREAIMEFHDRLGRLSERERVSMLRTFDELVPRIPARSTKAVNRELAELREARRSGGRRTAMRKRA
ncbi:MAG TPA: ribbon-helix-helix domain-containing protein [Bryobacteraceae bacterium]|nr:ribbon-helix-helix domain-containing protein [Bryobacteraceae bacterium]